MPFALFVDFWFDCNRFQLIIYYINNVVAKKTRHHNFFEFSSFDNSYFGMSPLVIFACIAYYGLAYSTNDYMIHSIWKPLRSLPNSMAYIIGGVHNDEIRILGGYTTTFLEIDSTLQSYEYRSSIQYTPSGGTKFALSPWYTTNISSNMSQGLIMGSDTQQYITINNFIYIIGTNDRSQFRDGPVDGKLFIYDMESQSFLSTTTYNSTMIIPRAGNCIATNNVHLFSMGGYDDTGTNTVTYIKYHIKGM